MRIEYRIEAARAGVRGRLSKVMWSLSIGVVAGRPGVAHVWNAGAASGGLKRTPLFRSLAKNLSHAADRL